MGGWGGWAVGSLGVACPWACLRDKRGWHSRAARACLPYDVGRDEHDRDAALGGGGRETLTRV